MMYSLVLKRSNEQIVIKKRISAGNSSKINYLDEWSFQTAILTMKKKVIIQIDVVHSGHSPLHYIREKDWVQLIFAIFCLLHSLSSE